MARTDLEKAAFSLEGILEKNPRISRRNLIKVLGILGIASCSPILSKEGAFNPNERYYFANGPDFAEHVRNGIEAGKDWITSYGNTLITPIAEGRVLYVRYFPQTKFHIEVEHFGGRLTTYGQLTEKFVDEFDYVGRNTIIGVGGSTTSRASGHGTSPPHIHVNYLILKNIFALIERKEDFTEYGNRPLFMLDPETQGQRKDGLELWKGEEMLSEYLGRTRRIIDYLNGLIPTAPPTFKNELNQASKNPRIDLNNSKVLLFNSALRKNEQWLTAEEKSKVDALIKEYANLRQPLTLPFVNPELDKIPGFYQRESTAKTLEEFTRQYASTLNMLKGRGITNLGQID